MADVAPDWTPYRYAFNNPISYIDPDGLFETKAEAQAHADDNGIKTSRLGWFGRSRIMENKDGSFSIDNRKAHTSISDLGGDLGVMTASMVSPTDVIEDNSTIFTIDRTTRSGDTIADIEVDRPSIGLPVGGAANGGAALLGGGIKIKNPIKEILKIPRKLLKKPAKRGQAPKFIKDGKSVEIHHIKQNPQGPFKEMHPKMHRGKGYHGRNHPNRNSRIDRKDFGRAAREYWKKVFDNW